MKTFCIASVTELNPNRKNFYFYFTMDYDYKNSESKYSNYLDASIKAQSLSKDIIKKWYENNKVDHYEFKVGIFPAIKFLSKDDNNDYGEGMFTSEELKKYREKNMMEEIV